MWLPGGCRCSLEEAEAPTRGRRGVRHRTKWLSPPPAWSKYQKRPMRDLVPSRKGAVAACDTLKSVEAVHSNGRNTLRAQRIYPKPPCKQAHRVQGAPKPTDLEEKDVEQGFGKTASSKVAQLRILKYDLGSDKLRKGVRFAHLPPFENAC